MGKQAVTSVGKTMLDIEVARSCLLIAFVPRSTVDSCIEASYALQLGGLEQIRMILRKWIAPIFLTILNDRLVN